MVIAIPYWWSKAEYDVCSDELRGGWRAAWLRITCAYTRCYSRKLEINIQWGIGAIFPRRDYSVRQ